MQQIYDRLEQLCGSVRDYVDEPFTIEHIKEWVEWGFTKFGTAQGIDLRLTPFRVMNAIPQKRYEAHISTIYAYCVESNKLLLRGRLKQAEQRFAKAVQYCGHLDEEEAAGFSERKTDEIKRQKASAWRQKASELGHAKAEKKYTPVKLELKRLLEEKKPVEGWKSMAAAAKALKSDIDAFQESIGRPLASTNLIRTLSKWLSADAGLKEVYERTKRV